MKKICRIPLILLLTLLSGCVKNNEDVTPIIEDPVIRTTFLLSSTYKEMHVGEIITLTPRLYNSKEGLAYTSSDKKVASVNTNGEVVALSVGTTEIWAFDSKSIAKCTIVVKEAKTEMPVLSLTVDYMRMKVGDFNSTTPIVKISGEEKSSLNVKVTLKEGSEDIVSYSMDGIYYVFTALKPGICVYSFTFEYQQYVTGANLAIEVIE